MAALVLTGCRWWQRGPDRAGTVRSAETYDDNQWQVSVAVPNHYNAVPTKVAFQREAKIEDMLASQVAALRSFCGGDEACFAGSQIVVEILPLSIMSPRDPSKRFAPETIQHFVDCARQAMAAASSGPLNATGELTSVSGIIHMLEGVVDLEEQAIASVANRKKAILDSASNRLEQEGAAVRGQELANLSSTKRQATAAAAAVTAYVDGAAALSALFAQQTQAFTAYRATEAAVLQKLTDLSGQASQSTLDNFGDIQNQLLALDGDQSQQSAQLLLAVERLRAQLAFTENSFQLRIAPYLDFMKANGMARPDATTVAQRSLGEMSGYCQSRENNLRSAMNRIMGGLEQRVQALVLQRADATSQPTLVAAAQLASSTSFINEINQRIAVVWQNPPQSPVLKLPYLAAQYDQVNTFLGVESLCSATPVPSYMQTGCKLLQPQLSKAHNWINKGLPSTINLDVYFMTQATVDPSQLAQLKGELATGNLAQAVLTHDTILRAADTPPLSGNDGGTNDSGTIDDTGEDE